jgi:hypothetical protein
LIVSSEKTDEAKRLKDGVKKRDRTIAQLNEIIQAFQSGQVPLSEMQHQNPAIKAEDYGQNDDDQAETSVNEG